MTKPVTLSTFPGHAEALVMLAKLEAAGIPCRIRDEVLNRNLPGSQGGIELLVYEDDLEKAKEIVGREEPDHVQIIETPDPEAEVICPICNSDDVGKTRFSSRWYRILYAFLGFLSLKLPYKPGKFHCFNCGYEFDRKKGSEQRLTT